MPAEACCRDGVVVWHDGLVLREMVCPRCYPTREAVERRELTREHDALRRRFESYDGGDRPSSPPVSLMRELRNAEDRLRTLGRRGFAFVPNGNVLVLSVRVYPEKS